MSSGPPVVAIDIAAAATDARISSAVSCWVAPEISLGVSVCVRCLTAAVGVSIG